MKDRSQILHRSLGKELQTAGYELVDFVAVPRHQERIQTFRNLEEILTDFESESSAGEYRTYLLQVRVKDSDEKKFQSKPMGSAQRPQTFQDGIYLANGKLNSDYLMSNARTLLKAKEYALARQIFEALLKNGDMTARSLEGIGSTFEGEGNLTEALKKYEESFVYQPLQETLEKHAGLLFRVGSFPQAAESYERGTKIKDISEEARIRFLALAGKSWSQAQNPAKAERCLKQLLDIVPHHTDALLDLGKLYFAQKRFADARDAFNRALRENSTNDVALFQLGLIALEQGEKERAHDFFAQSLRINLHQAKAIFNLVKTAYEIRQYDTAAEILTDYISCAPFNANLLYSLAGLQYHLNRRADALKSIAQIQMIQPDHSEAAKLKEIVERQPS